MEFMFMRVVGTTTSTVISTARINSHFVWLDTSRCCATAWSTSARNTLSSSATSLSASANSATALPLMRLAMVAVS